MPDAHKHLGTGPSAHASAALGGLDRDQPHYRKMLHWSKLASVEDSSVSPSAPPPCGYETDYQVALPYFGLFAYVVGSKRQLLDPNRTLFVSPGWEFSDEHPVPGLGHAALLINPSRGLLDEVCSGPGSGRDPMFVQASRPSTLRLRLLVHHLRHWHAYGDGTTYIDEWVIQALREAVAKAPRSRRRASDVVDRAKQVLHARGCDRLSLEEIARDVGVTPVYLTQEFSRSEGMPLYRYQMRLRIDRALLELPHCEDITGLALDLGFSSHSHFGSVFRRAVGMTPSGYRSSAGLLRRADLQRHLREDIASGSLRAA